jgi:hypothetical protein
MTQVKKENNTVKITLHREIMDEQVLLLTVQRALFALPLGQGSLIQGFRKKTN